MRDNGLSRGEWVFARWAQVGLYTVVCLTTAGRETVPGDGLPSPVLGGSTRCC